MNAPRLPLPLAAAPRLTSRQKWRLAFSLSALYLPILFYINLADWSGSWVVVQHHFPLFAVGVGVALPLFFVWLSVAERLQAQLFRWFGEDFWLELQPPAQVLTLVFSLLLALAYGAALSATLAALNRVLPLYAPVAPGALPAAGYLALYQRANNSFFLLLMLSTFYLLATSQALLRARASHQRAEQLETENLQAQLAALKNQVNPHFLFNSLSILSSLVHLDANLSEQFIDQLAQAYRYALEQKDHDLVPLATELDFIAAYTFLLKIRFEDQFDVHLDVPAAAQQHYRIAPLTLQLLVENAVKHNQMSSEQPLRVHIHLDADELVVRNSLQKRPSPGAISTQVGLSNIHNRYRLLTPRRVQVAEVAAEFIVRIPLLP